MFSKFIHLTVLGVVLSSCVWEKMYTTVRWPDGPVTAENCGSITMHAVNNGPTPSIIKNFAGEEVELPPNSEQDLPIGCPKSPEHNTLYPITSVQDGVQRNLGNHPVLPPTFYYSLVPNRFSLDRLCHVSLSPSSLPYPVPENAEVKVNVAFWKDAEWMFQSYDWESHIDNGVMAGINGHSIYESIENFPYSSPSLIHFNPREYGVEKAGLGFSFTIPAPQVTTGIAYGTGEYKCNTTFEVEYPLQPVDHVVELALQDVPGNRNFWDWNADQYFEPWKSLGISACAAIADFSHGHSLESVADYDTTFATSSHWGKGSKQTLGCHLADVPSNFVRAHGDVKLFIRSRLEQTQANGHSPSLTIWIGTGDGTTQLTKKRTIDASTDVGAFGYPNLILPYVDDIDVYGADMWNGAKLFMQVNYPPDLSADINDPNAYVDAAKIYQAIPRVGYRSH